MNLKTYLIILKTGVYLSFVSVFLVFQNLLFPYITSKQISFNILVEILAIFWLGLIIKFPAVRPKKSWITYGLAAFFAALLISTFFSIDFNLSFWGDIERMLGWFHVAHFFLFYLIIITVFRTAKDWRNLFIVSLVAATGVCLYSLVKTPMSTIGNTAYVSGYAIFNLFFALILFFRFYQEENGKDWLMGSPFLIVAFIMLLVMKQTNTRGAIVGLGVSFVLFFLLHIFYSQSKKLKIYSLSALLCGIAVVSLVYAYPKSGLAKLPILKTIPQISSKAVTLQTRLISWKTAAKDFKNHPILGTGYGNFAITFDKFFDPKFYSYTTSETYFDRAHNNLVDLASTGGLVSLLTYLSIFGAVGYYLFRGKKQGRIETNEFILLVCLFTAYFIQNLAVFDSLPTYLSLMPALAYVYWLLNGEEDEELGESKLPKNSEWGVLAVAGVVLLTILYQYNIKPLWMLDGTIAGQISFAKGDFPGGVEEYKKALSYNTGLDRDSRASLINAINAKQGDLLSLDKEQAREIADYVISLAEANVKLNPADSMMQMQLAQILSTASLLYQDNSEKFTFYSDRALAAMEESIKASPGRVTTYFGKAQIYIMRNDKENTINTLRYAYNLNQEYAEAACYLAKVLIFYKEDTEGYAVMDKCLELGGVSFLNPPDILKLVLNHYSEKKDIAKVLIIYERLSIMEPKNAEIWINLALLYAETGKSDQAIEAARKAMELDYSLKTAAEDFIKKLEAGK